MRLGGGPCSRVRESKVASPVCRNARKVGSKKKIIYYCIREASLIQTWSKPQLVCRQVVPRQAAALFPGGCYPRRRPSRHGRRSCFEQGSRNQIKHCQAIYLSDWALFGQCRRVESFQPQSQDCSSGLGAQCQAGDFKEMGFIWIMPSVERF